MATTTNYGWTTPNDTDLVKDGAAAIRTLGSSVDTTTKALNPSTTLGDIEYRSSTANTNTRLGIGSSGQVLTVAAGVPSWATPSSGMTNPLTTTGDTIYSSSGSTPARLGIGSTGQVLTVAAGIPSWATASAGAMTKIAAATFSNVAAVNVDSVFSSTYKSYIININATNESDENADFYFRCRNATPATITSGYSGGGQKINRAGTASAMASDNATVWTLTTDMSSTGVGSNSTFSINVNGITGSTERPGFTQRGLSNPSTPGLYVHGAVYCDAANIRGFNLSASTGNITGDYQVYGLEK